MRLISTRIKHECLTLCSFMLLLLYSVLHCDWSARGILMEFQSLFMIQNRIPYLFIVCCTMKNMRQTFRCVLCIAEKTFGAPTLIRYGCVCNMNPLSESCQMCLDKLVSLQIYPKLSELRNFCILSTVHSFNGGCAICKRIACPPFANRIVSYRGEFSSILIRN